MKTQTQFKNASLVSVVNGSIVIKDSTGREHTFTNASVVSVNNGTIIIESEWEPKKGELVKMEGNGTNCYAIFKNIEGSFLYDYGYRFFREDQLICNHYGWNARNVTISPVTPEEQKEFDDFCKSQGKLWNKETLQWEKYQWQPKKGESYFYVLSSMSGIRVCHALWADCTGDYLLYDTHNCFRTEKQAERAAEKVKELFKSL
jgi:uncharacterized protein YifE (UPF0438 family)